MRTHISFRRVATAVIVALTMLVASCTTTQKYGCPNKLASADVR